MNALQAWRSHAAEQHDERLRDLRKLTATLRDDIVRQREEIGNSTQTELFLNSCYAEIDDLDDRGPPKWPVSLEKVDAKHQIAVLESLHLHYRGSWPNKKQIQYICTQPKALHFYAAQGIKFPTWLF